MQNKPEYTRFLPHYHPVGATFFVTFRLDRSLPKLFLAALATWYKAEKERIVSEKRDREKEQALFLLQRDYFYKFDRALGQCLCGPVFLQEPAAAYQVVTQLTLFDGSWYHLLAYTILPNHVHALFDLSAQCPADEVVDLDKYKNLDYLMERIKGASARYINLALHRTGESCWFPEYHDRYIRNQRHLLAAVDYIKYIKQNVVSARLCLHWREHAFTWVHERFW